MEITSYPTDYQSACREVCFTIEGAELSESTDIEIYCNDENLPCGIKRFYGTGPISVNTACYAQRKFEITPATGKSTGLYSMAGRSVEVHVKCGDLNSLRRRVVAGPDDAPLRTKLSHMPALKRMPANGYDEISFIAPGDFVQFQIVLRGEETELAFELSEQSCDEGIYSLIVNFSELNAYFENTIPTDSDQLQEVEVIAQTEIQTICKQTYQIDRSSQNGTMLCWINRYGMIDYYLFPFTTNRRFSAERQRIYSKEGYRTVSVLGENLLRLESDFETDACMEWLSEIIIAPRIWIVRSGKLEPMDLVDETMETYNGELGLASFDLRYAQRTNPVKA